MLLQSMMTLPEDWVELAFGYDRDEVKILAEAEFARFGFTHSELTGDELRLDIGLDGERGDFYRVSIRRSLIGKGSGPR